MSAPEPLASSPVLHGSARAARALDPFAVRLQLSPSDSPRVSCDLAGIRVDQLAHLFIFLPLLMARLVQATSGEPQIGKLTAERRVDIMELVERGTRLGMEGRASGSDGGWAPILLEGLFPLP